MNNNDHINKIELFYTGILLIFVKIAVIICFLAVNHKIHSSKRCSVVYLHDNSNLHKLIAFSTKL